MRCWAGVANGSTQPLTGVLFMVRGRWPWLVGLLRELAVTAASGDVQLVSHEAAFIRGQLLRRRGDELHELGAPLRAETLTPGLARTGLAAAAGSAGTRTPTHWGLTVAATFGNPAKLRCQAHQRHARPG